MEFAKNVLKIFGIVLLRFRPLPRAWNYWLVSVNLACLFFIGHLEAQVLLGTTLVAVVVQATIYGKTGFSRLLGIGHIFWVPMFAWMATRIEHIAAHPDLQMWLVVLAITNAVSAVIDITDVTRFVRGERAPHYSWA